MKPINQHAPVTGSKKISINASPDKVWSLLSGINDWPTWNSDISRASLSGQLCVAATFSWQTGGVSIRSTLHTVNPYSQLGWTGKTMGLYAIHNWTLKEVNGQTEVFVEESMEGILASLLRKTLSKNLLSGMQQWLDQLKQECEK